ncbi:hypothetical protein [Alloactinosynnema sp. L-07]|nr:hypothetical protein [Alloactinosynnema sp. L-07]
MARAGADPAPRSLVDWVPPQVRLARARRAAARSARVRVSARQARRAWQPELDPAALDRAAVVPEWLEGLAWRTAPASAARTVLA